MASVVLRAVASVIGVAPAWTVGFSACTYVLPQSLLSAALGVLLAHAAGRHVPTRRALAIVLLLGVLPLSMVPGAIAQGAASNTYMDLERLALAVLALLWTPPKERSVARSTAAGLVVGAWQFVKLGGALVAAATVVSPSGGRQ